MWNRAEVFDSHHRCHGNQRPSLILVHFAGAFSQTPLVRQALKLHGISTRPRTNFCQINFSIFCFVNFLWFFSWTICIFPLFSVPIWTLTLNNGTTETVIKKVIWQKFYLANVYMTTAWQPPHFDSLWEKAPAKLYPIQKIERGENSR